MVPSKPDLNRIRHFSREGIWILIGHIASGLGLLVLVRVLTEHLDPVQYGQLALGMTVAGLMNQVVMGGVSSGVGRFYSVAAEKGGLGGYLSGSRQLMLFATLAVLSIGLTLLAGLLLLGYGQWIGLTAAILALSIISGYNSSLSGIQIAARQRPVVAFHVGLDAWLKIVLAIGVMLWLGNYSIAVVIGYLVSSLLVTASQLYFLRKLIPSQDAPPVDCSEWIRRIWAYSWPFSVWGIFTWAHQSSDRWALEAFATTQDVGLYTVLFQLGYYPITVATGIIMEFLGPILYQRSGDATDPLRNASVHRLTRRIVLSSLSLTLIAFLLALGLHERVFHLLVAKEYRSLSFLLPWMVLAGGLFAAGQILALKMMSEMKSVAMLRAKIMTAILGIFFNAYGARIGGVKGITTALLLFSVVYFVWMHLLSFRLSTGSQRFSFLK
jgi:O-antigen/teichoic acid export membrane protein